MLVIDDNDVNRSILSEQLDVWRFEHAGCASGQEGLQVMRAAAELSLSPDLVILDYQMPEMTGADVLREMRSDVGLKDIPVIILTSVDSASANRALAGLGADATLTKPTRSSLMLETMVDVISRARAKSGTVAAKATFADIAAQAAAGQSAQPEKMKARSAPQDTGSTYAEQPEDPNQGTGLLSSDRSATDDDSKTSVVSACTQKVRPSKSTGAKSSSNLDILVAEDNEVNQIVIRQILEESGHSYKIVENGRLAVASYKVHRPQLILMDVSMPEMNGIEATTAIRALEREDGAHTPIVGVTAHALKGNMEKCLDAGMDDYLSKPISVSKLNEKLTQYLGDSSATKIA